MRQIQPEPIKTATIIRSIILAVALINQMLVGFGYSPLPINDENAELIVATAFTAVASIVTWWKNNALTRDARKVEKIAKQEGLK